MTGMGTIGATGEVKVPIDRVEKKTIAGASLVFH